MAEQHPNRLADELLAQLAITADAYPQRVDFARASVLVVLLDRKAYRAASFLDDRILTPATRGAWLPLAGVRAAAARWRHGLPVHFVFHTGHVGSTLVSRLLDESGVVQPLREPLPLRALADASDAVGSPGALSAAEFASLVELFMRL